MWEALEDAYSKLRVAVSFFFPLKIQTQTLVGRIFMNFCELPDYDRENSNDSSISLLLFCRDF